MDSCPPNPLPMSAEIYEALQFRFYEILSTQRPALPTLHTIPSQNLPRSELWPIWQLLGLVLSFTRNSDRGKDLAFYLVRVGVSWNTAESSRASNLIARGIKDLPRKTKSLILSLPPHLSSLHYLPSISLSGSRSIRSCYEKRHLFACNLDSRRSKSKSLNQQRNSRKEQ